MTKKDSVIVLTDFVPLDQIQQDHQSYHQPELLEELQRKYEHQRQVISDTPILYPVQTEKGDKG